MGNAIYRNDGAEWKRVRNVRHKGDSGGHWSGFPDSPVSTYNYPYQAIYVSSSASPDFTYLIYSTQPLTLYAYYNAVTKYNYGYINAESADTYFYKLAADSMSWDESITYDGSGWMIYGSYNQPNAYLSYIPEMIDNIQHANHDILRRYTGTLDFAQDTPGLVSFARARAIKIKGTEWGRVNL